MVQLGMASGNVKTAEVRKWHLVRWIFLVADAQKWPLGRNEVTQNDTLMVRNYLIYKRMTFLKQNHAKNRSSAFPYVGRYNHTHAMFYLYS
jgi:hypothetical protein